MRLWVRSPAPLHMHQMWSMQPQQIVWPAIRGCENQQVCKHCNRVCAIPRHHNSNGEGNVGRVKEEYLMWCCLFYFLYFGFRVMLRTTPGSAPRNQWDLEDHMGCHGSNVVNVYRQVPFLTIPLTLSTVNYSKDKNLKLPINGWWNVVQLI